jgi:hypothetical protein
LISRFSTVFVLIFRLSTVFVLFKFPYLRRSKSIADSMTIASSTLQIWKHDYSGHLNLLKSIVGIVTFVDIKPFYAINSDAVSLFAYSSFLIFKEFEYIIISIDVIYQFE